MPSRLVRKKNWNGGAIPDGEKNEDMYKRLDRIPACDRRTDGRTDGHISCYAIVRAMHTRRAVKIYINNTAFGHYSRRI